MRTSHYARSLKEFDRSAREWVQETKRYCAQAEEQQAEAVRRRDSYESSTTRLSDKLLAEGAFGDFVEYGLSEGRYGSAQVEFVFASSEGWAARVTGKIEKNLGCTTWGGKVPATVLADGFAASNKPGEDHLHCDHILSPNEGGLLLELAGSKPPWLESCDMIRTLANLHQK